MQNMFAMKVAVLVQLGWLCLDFADAIKRDGRNVIEKYGNLFDMYKQITGDDPYTMPMMIYPAVHYTMGGLWVDYNLMTTVPVYTLWASAISATTVLTVWRQRLDAGFADGYFVIPYTIGDYLATLWLERKGRHWSSCFRGSN